MKTFGLSKRLAALLTAVCLMLFSAISVGSEPIDGTILTNEDFLFLEHVGVLTADDLPMLTAVVSRNVFVKLIMKASGQSAETYVESSAQAPFDDLGDNAQYVLAAHALGLISDADDRLFYPYENITAPQAAKILVELLGYGPYAAIRGGYPAGYLAVAAELELFEGCEPADSESISYVEVFRLIRNAMHCSLYEAKGLADSDIIYSDNSENTLLSKYFDIYRAEGLVQADSFTSLTYSEGVSKGRVQVGNVVYEDGAEVDDKLGRYINAYYRMENEGDVGTIIHAEDHRKTTVWEIRAKDIDDGQTTLQEFVYYDESEREQKIDIAYSASMIYNGKFEKMTPARLIPKKGDVTLVDNDGDGTADVVLVNHYTQTIWVNGVSSTGTVSDKLSTSVLSLDPESIEYETEITKNGERISVGQIVNENVISAAIPDTKASYYRIRVQVSDSGVEGVLNAYDAGHKTVMINDTEYDVSSDTMSRIKLGQEGMFYLDAFGEVIARSEYKTVIYGYLYDMAQFGLRGGVQAKIFTENNRWAIVPLEEALSFNNARCNAVDLLENDLLFPLAEGKRTINPQLIAYRVTPDRTISMIQTALDDTDTLLGETSTAIAEDQFRLSYASGAEYYRSYSGSFGEKVYIGKEAKVFMIPAKDENFEEEIMVDGVGRLVNDRSYKNLRVFNRSASGVSTLFMMEKNLDSQIGLGTLVVDGVSRGINMETGKEGYSIKGWVNGNETSILTDGYDITVDAAGFAVTDLASGDIIQYEQTRDKTISKIYLKYDCSAGPKGIVGAYSYSGGNIYNSWNFVGGTIKMVDLSEDMLVLEYGANLLAGLSLSQSDLMVYRFDTAANTLKRADKNELLAGRKVFSAMTYMRVKTIVIYD